jgi:hypothetical protein
VNVYSRDPAGDVKRGIEYGGEAWISLEETLGGGAGRSFYKTRGKPALIYVRLAI